LGDVEARNVVAAAAAKAGVVVSEEEQREQELVSGKDLRFCSCCQGFCWCLVPVACCVLASLGWMGSAVAMTEGAVGLVRQLLGDMEAKTVATAAAAAKAGVVVSEEEQREQELLSMWLGGMVCLLPAVF
jgi:hypothetical protein